MPRITVSYRRDDSGVITGRIFDRLAAHYGRESVFRDIDSIPLGADFREHISEVLDLSDIVLAIVGPRWVGTRSGQNRLDNEGDPVRVEIETALRKKVPLIPVLVLRASMPRPTQLPEALQDFAYRNAVQVDSGQDFDVHLARMIKAMDRILAERGHAAAATSPQPGDADNPQPDPLLAAAVDAALPTWARLRLWPARGFARGAGVAVAGAILGIGATLGIEYASRPALPSAPPAVAALASAKQAAEGKAEALQGELADAEEKSTALQKQLDEQARLMRGAQTQIAELNGRIKVLASGQAVAPAPKPAAGDDTAIEASWTKGQKRKVQQALQTFGGYRGAADGVFDAATRAAIRQFQSFAGTPQTGVLTGTEHQSLLDIAGRLAALLHRPPVSPAGTPADTVPGGAQRYAKAWAFETGKGARRDTAEAAYWYALAAADGERKALTNLGILLAQGAGVTAADPAGAVLLWRAAAANGEAIAMYDIGAAYEHGIGVDTDLSLARHWYARAGAANNAQAQAALKRLGS